MDNAPAHTGALAMEELRDLKYELLEQSLYWPDLASSNFHLSTYLKKVLAGKRFGLNKDMVAAVDEYFAYVPELHSRGVHASITLNLSICESVIQSMK